MKEQKEPRIKIVWYGCFGTKEQTAKILATAEKGIYARTRDEALKRWPNVDIIYEATAREFGISKEHPEQALFVPDL